MEKEKRIHLKVPSDTFYLGLVRKTLVEVLSRIGIGEEDQAMIEMAVDEACTNAIEHAYPNGREVLREYHLRRKEDMGCAIDVTLIASKGRLQVNILDKGEQFDFYAEGNINIDEYLEKMQVGGLGIYVIKTLMDEATYTHIKGVGNELKLVKYLNTPHKST